MKNTAVEIPDDLEKEIAHKAETLGISLEEFILKAVKQALKNPADAFFDNDSFWSDDAVYEGDVPADYSVNHDKHLYPDPK